MNVLKRHLSCMLLLGIFAPSGLLYANPAGHSVVNGSASFHQQGNSLNITNTPGTIINWQDFSIQQGETTKFIQQSVDSAVLNRVTSQNPSEILGSLQSNGRVFILNPNGISFGKDSIVDVGGLVASTLNLSNENFLSQQLSFTGDSSNGDIVNSGEIITPEGGFIYLIAPNIENHGVITSPKGEVILAAGHSVQLVDSNNPDIRVTLKASEGEVVNVGKIITRGGKTNIYAGLINQQGIISADSAVVGENGKIFFKASNQTILSSNSSTTANGVNGGSVIIETSQGLTEVSGKVSAKGIDGKGGEILILGDHVGIINTASIDASGTTAGGTVLIGGDNKGENPNVKNAKATYVGVDTQIHADAINEGDGGKVIIWSDDATRAYGTITAKGGSVFGNGGFVETSGGYLDVAGLNLDVTSANGNGGSWLLDPYDIIISGTTTINVTGVPTYTATATGSNISVFDINDQLNAGTSVTVDTTGAGAESGNITVNAPILKSSGAVGATLTLKAHNNIIVNSSIASSFDIVNFVLIADQDSNGAGSVTLNNTLSTLFGDITISAAGDITFNSGTDTINAANGAVTLTSFNGWVHGDPAGAPTDVTANTVTLNALNGIFANSGSAQFTTKAANIIFNKSGTVFPSEVKIHNSYAGATTITGVNSRGNISIFNTYNAAPLTVGNIAATADGYISINTDIIDITGNINAGTNSVYLKNFTNNALVSIGGSALFDINSLELGNISGGDIQIGRDPFGNSAGSANIATAIAVNMGGSNVTVTAQNGISAGPFNITNTGGQLSLNNTISGDITTGSGLITANSIFFNSLGNMTIGSGGISSAANLSLITSGTLTQSGTLTSTSTGAIFLTANAATLNAITSSGDIVIQTDQITITNPINAGVNSVYIMPRNNNPISIDGSELFNLTQGELGNIFAANVWIGTDGMVTRATTASISTLASTTLGATKLNLRALNNIIFGANNFSASGAEVNFRSDNGSITTGAGALSADKFILEGLGAMSVGTGGISATTFVGLNGGDASIGGIITAPTLYISNFTPGLAISIGGGQAYNLSQADINNINATTVEIGNHQFIANTNNVNIATATAVDFGARNVIVRSNNGMLIGGQTFKATGGNLTLKSLNAGFDITTGAGNIAADSVTIQSGRDVIVNSGGVNAVNSITLAADNTVSQNGNLTANGTGTITVTATNQDITMAAGTTTTGGDGDIVYNAGNNITVALLDSGFADTTINAGADVIDINGNGVNNVNANNLIVSSGGNASLDYQVLNVLDASGITGIADLRVFPATTTTTTTTTATAPSSTNEPLTTTVDTISDTTNSLSTDVSLTETSTSTAPLDSTTTETSTTDEPVTTTSSTEETTTTTDESSTSSEEGSTDEDKEEQTETTEKKDEKKSTLTSKKLPNCK